jgi:hypothetical protein
LKQPKYSKLHRSAAGVQEADGRAMSDVPRDIGGDVATTALPVAMRATHEILRPLVAGFLTARKKTLTLAQEDDTDKDRR